MKRPLFPLQYEPNIPRDYTERGSETGAKASPEMIDNPDMKRIYEATHDMPLKEALKWVEQHKDEFDPTTVIVGLAVTNDFSLKNRYQDLHPKVFVVRRPLNTITYLDEFLCQASDLLENGGYICCNSRTAVLKKQVILEHYPFGINYLIFLVHYLWHRVCPKLWLTKEFYFHVTKGRNRTFNRVEILGRLYRAGFEVIEEGFLYGQFFVIGHKVDKPKWNDTPSGSPIIKLHRVGKGGKIINVYKFRTMYSYSEYIQPYIYDHHHLRDGGKFANDYRVNSWGKLLRAIWLDEFPMIWNVLKGELKLVGVRPLSQQYFSLYSPEMQKLHISVKPGLMPPFYYEDVTPVSIEDVQASERRYIEAYHQHPFRTDWKYFWGIVRNIVIKRKKSH